MGSAHVVLRKSRYHFRMAVPTDVRGYIGRREIHVSLHEGDSRKARLKAGLFAFEVRRLIDLVRQAVKTLNEVEVRALVAGWRRQMVDKDSAIRRRIEVGLEPFGLPSYEGNCAGISDMLSDLLGSLVPAMPDHPDGLERYAPSQREREQAFVKAAECATGEPTEDSLPLIDPIEFASLDLLSQRNLLLTWLPIAAGLFDEKAAACHQLGSRLAHAPQLTQSVAVAALTERELASLGEVWGNYLAHKATTDNAWKDKPAGKASLAGGTFLGLIGRDKPIGKVSREDIDRYEWFVNHRPPRSNGASANEDILALEETMKEAGGALGDRLGRRTVDEYLQRIVRFFDWAKHKGYVKEHYAAGMAYKIDEDDLDEERDRLPWSDEEIRQMLDPRQLKAYIDKRSEQALQAHRWTYLPWFLLLLCYTGARRGELGGLMVDDIVVRREMHRPNVYEVPVAYIRRNRIRPSLKNKGAERSVPLHPHLVDLGFIALVERRRASGADRVLWNPVSGGDVSTKVSNDFSAYIKAIGLSDPSGKKVLHSLRHSFKTKATGRIDAKVLDSIMGHAPRDSTGGSYVHYLDMERRDAQESLSTLDFGLDLEGLKSLLSACIPET